jgi:hypothetical protein
MAAVLGGNLEDLDVIGVELRRLRRVKDDLLRTYKAHIAAHGC